MTNMSQKSQEQKRSRRQRYKSACKPIMERYNCTSMQVAGVVQGIQQNNNRLRDENLRLIQKIEELKDELEKQKTRRLEAELRLSQATSPRTEG